MAGTRGSSHLTPSFPHGASLAETGGSRKRSLPRRRPRDTAVARGSSARLLESGQSKRDCPASGSASSFSFPPNLSLSRFGGLRCPSETVELRHVVVAWLDHTKAVAAEHYLMVTDDDYERAAAMVRKTDHITDHSPAFSIRQRPSPETTTAVSPACASDTAVSIPPRGVEPRFSD